MDTAKLIKARGQEYGDVRTNFTRIAEMWSAIKGVQFEPREVALFMIAVKLSRLTHKDKEDSWDDISGYAQLGKEFNAEDTRTI